MTLTELEQIITLAADSGGSPRGISYWTEAAHCGAKAVLRERAREAAEQLTYSLPSEKNRFVVGSAYHKLRELWDIGTVEPKVFNYQEPNINPNVAEALRLFNGWGEFWPKDLWGEVVALEEVVPTEETSPYPKSLGGHVTVKPDRVSYMHEWQVLRAQELCQVQLDGEGYYIVDYKTADTPGEDSLYSNGLQSRLYPPSWEVEYPDEPIKGMIFDIIYKFGRRKDKSVTKENFHQVFVKRAPLDLPENFMLGIVQQGLANMERYIQHGIGNRANCANYVFGQMEFCPFYNVCDAR